MKLSETLKKAIGLANAIDEYWDRELPKRFKNYPLVQPGEDAGPPPPEEKRLRDLFESLPDETIYKIALLMHLGRYDFDTRNLSESYKELKDRYETAADAIIQMIDYPPLAYQLSEGLAKLEKDGIDVDKLPLKKAAVAR